MQKKFSKYVLFDKKENAFISGTSIGLYVYHCRENEAPKLYDTFEDAKFVCDVYNNFSLEIHEVKLTVSSRVAKF